MTWAGRLAAGLALLGGAACSGRPPNLSPPPVAPTPAMPSAAAADHTLVPQREPALAPRIAFLAGLLPRHATGVDSFLREQPTFDGRGVLIAILDSGLDPGLPGLQRTSAGQRKILDMRDFSGECRIRIQPVVPDGNGVVTVEGIRVQGFGRVAAVSRGPYFAGVFDEHRLAALPAADVNGNGVLADRFPVIVARASDGWLLFTDTDGDGTLADEHPVRDFAVAYDTFSYRADPRRPAPMNFAVNLTDSAGAPVVDFVMDNSSHGSHVAGIAAGHNLFGVDGFDGVAPGAQLLGLKIANGVRGGSSTTGAMARALDYAADFARRRNLPLVVNLSFGVGNESEGAAAIDSIIDVFAERHRDVLVVSAGNDGPGLSTVDFPGTAAAALTVCALFPGVFAWNPAAHNQPPPDVLGSWSARGAETAKPDVCAPGVAYSNVPGWRIGEEVSGGTSMATPEIAGAAALLQSALVGGGSPAARAVELKRALMASAVPIAGTTVLDEGSGVPNVPAAYRWLRAGHQAGRYRVTALPDGGNRSGGTAAAYRRDGLASPGDTIQRFEITSLEGQPAARLLLESDAGWLHAPPVLEMGGGPATLTVTYDAEALTEPGLYVGTVWARPATDTSGGPALQLTNTIVVPHDLAVPLAVHAMLTPGGVARSFVTVPPESGGLTVELRVERAGPGATAYVFEPSGRPQRGTGSIEAGEESGKVSALSVAGEDMVPGVYEIAVVAPPADPVSYELAVSLPPIAVTRVGPGLSATLANRSGEAMSTRVESAIVGAVRVDTVSGRGSAPVVRWSRVPEWASRLRLDVDLPVELWNRLTDFAVTVYDSAGIRVSDGPLNYASGRQSIELGARLQGTRISVELVPAFAAPDVIPAWGGRLRLAYFASTADSLVVDGVDSLGTVSLGPGESRDVRLVLPDNTLAPPSGFRRLVQVAAVPDSGSRSVRSAAVDR